ncbi:MAG: MaoC/PaaZ C-terminal domain-containing protein [Gammaproteobacteria bacterium]|nr:MaoC/PaaZ C-terminal domain-containing protein [Gammaproteobacteria bacterium]
MLYFDDIEVGYHSRVGSYTLTESEVVEFASTWDPQPFHIDKDAASASIFGGLTASSLHLFAICTRLFFDHEDRIQILAMLGKEAIRIPNPARPGDVLTYTTECVQKKPSSSRPDRGVITLKDTLANQHGQAVLTQEVALLVARRNHRSV